MPFESIDHILRSVVPPMLPVATTGYTASMAKSKPRRIIMRVEVRPGTPAKLAEVVDEFGATNISVVSRLAEWFVLQDEETQLEILGSHPAINSRG